MKAFYEHKFDLLLIGLIAIAFAFLHYFYNLFNLPYFWDELGVYSRSAIHLYKFGIGFLPSALPDELSRGHPTLIPIIWAASFKTFGCNVFVAKATGAVLYTIGMYYVYRIFLLKYKAFHACLFTFIISIQPAFIAQSVLILPEGPLMVFSIMAFYYYLQEKHIQLSIAITLALFTKESALILPMAFFLTDLFFKKLSLKKTLFTGVMPLTIITIYFIFQKFQRGYFFYPLHTSLVKIEYYFINERFRVFYNFVFHSQGRIFIWLIAPLVLTSYKFFTAFKSIQFDLKRTTVPNIKCIKISKLSLSVLIFFLLGMSFAVLNYYLTRYTLYYLVMVYIAFFYILFQKENLNILHYASLLVLFGFSIIYSKDNVYTDVNFSYVEHIKSCQKTIDFLNVDSNKNKTVVMDFPIAVACWDNLSGYYNYLHFKPSSNWDTSALHDDFYVFTYPGNIDNAQNYKNKLDFVTKISSGYAYTEIYKKRKSVVKPNIE